MLTEHWRSITTRHSSSILVNWRQDAVADVRLRRHSSIVYVTRCSQMGRPRKINQSRTGLAVDSYLLPTSKSRDTKTRSKIKNPALISFRYCALIWESVVICQPHYNWERRWPLKMAEFRLSRARGLDLDLGSGHTAYRHAEDSEEST